jgi:hypothetical protein
MKFFLPEHYVRLHSPDEDVSDWAERELEKASERYEQHLARIKPRLPATVARFMEATSLHDAEVFAPARISQPIGAWQAGDVVLVTQQVNTLFPETLHTLAFLHYQGCEEVRIECPCPSDVFHPAQPTWLYDEFDVEPNGHFSHCILLTDGRMFHHRFRHFHWYFAPLANSNGTVLVTESETSVPENHG